MGNLATSHLASRKELQRASEKERFLKSGQESHTEEKHSQVRSPPFGGQKGLIILGGLPCGSEQEIPE